MKSHLIAIAVGIGSFGAGAVVGYKVAERRLALEFDERLEEEIGHMKVFYTNVPQQKFATPEDAVAELVLPEAAEKALEDYKGNKNDKVAYHKVVKSDVVVENTEVFEKPLPTQQNVFDRAAERDPTKPYIISQEEFMLNETGYEQVAVTWYAADEKLADEKDDVIEDAERILGTEFKVNFGTESSDENTVHIRNERLGIEFEVNRHGGSFSMEVLGVEPTKPHRPSGRG